MKKISLLATAFVLFTGCSAVDDAINDAVNDALSGEVTANTMKVKDKVVIINNVNRTACFTIKQGLISNEIGRASCRERVFRAV